MLLFFPSQPGRILQARQDFASPNFCLGSLEWFGAEQNRISEFPHAYRKLATTAGECVYGILHFEEVFLSRHDIL
jgi:hypothetical protein